MNVNKISKIVWLVMMTGSKNTSYHLKNDKDNFENENNRKKKNCDYDAKFNS